MAEDRKPCRRDSIRRCYPLTTNDALTACTGMYDGIRGNLNPTSYYGARMFYYGDVRADDVCRQELEVVRYIVVL
ncbi:hypothetical protein NXV85_23400 [Bacteroides fragilis]|nr:hypothetical protein [Bacteroides fragilis]